MEDPTRPRNFPKWGKEYATHADITTTMDREDTRPTVESRKRLGFQPSKIFQTDDDGRSIDQKFAFAQSSSESHRPDEMTYSETS